MCSLPAARSLANEFGVRDLASFLRIVSGSLSPWPRRTAGRKSFVPRRETDKARPSRPLSGESAHRRKWPSTGERGLARKAERLRNECARRTPEEPPHSRFPASADCALRFVGISRCTAVLFRRANSSVHQALRDALCRPRGGTQLGLLLSDSRLPACIVRVGRHATFARRADAGILRDFHFESKVSNDRKKKYASYQTTEV